MHIITCPKCRTRLRLEKPVTKVKVRCKKCGTVFIGTSESVPEQPEAKTAAAVADIASHARTGPGGKPVHDIPRGYRPTPAVRPKGAPWMLIVVIVAVLGIIIAAVAGYWIHTHPYVEIKDENGKLVYAGRMHIDEYNSRTAAIEEKKKKLAEADKTARPANTTTDNGDKTTTDGSVVVTETIKLPENPTDKNTPKEDLDIPVFINPTPLTVVPGRVDFVGEVRNNHDYPLASATVHVSVRDAEGVPLAAGTVIVNYIPAKGMVPFSVNFKMRSESRVAGVNGYATGARIPAGGVCWELGTNDCKKDFDKTTGGTFVLSGSVANRNDFDVAEAKVYVDFFDRDGRHLGSATGKLDKPNIDNIPAGKKAQFRVDFETFDPTLVEKWTARLVGKVS